MYTDCHVHTDFSSDSSTPMEAQVKRAIDLGMKALCITDHQDFDFPYEICHMTFQFDTQAYYDQLMKLKEQYQDQIALRFGVELGLMPHLASRLKEYTKQWDFDYIIGSTHIVDGMDPYYPEYFENRTADASLMRYLDVSLENLQACYPYIDSAGHLDYITRYVPDEMEAHYPGTYFQDKIDEILTFIIQHDLALECNTAGLRKGCGYPNPHMQVLSRYAQLGGEMVTLGSDAHVTVDLGYAFSDIGALLKSCGIKAITTFIKREPQFTLL